MSKAAPRSTTESTSATQDGPARTLDVAMVDPSLFTPPYDSALCDALVDRGHRVRLIGRPARADDPPLSPRIPMEPMMYRGSEKLRGLGVDGRRFLAAKGVEHLVDSARLVRRIRALRPDVVHFQWFTVPFADLATARMVRRFAPVVLTVHDTNLFHGDASSSVQVLGWKALLRSVDACIVHTASSRPKLTAVGVDDARIHEVPHGLLMPISDGGEPPAPRADDGILRLLMFGQVQRYKGVDVLLRALAALEPKTRDKVRLVVAGNISFPREELTDLARTLGVEDNVEWRFGFVPDEVVASTFAESDVCVFPYRDIDASGALMLALHYGRAILSSRIGVFAELLNDDTSALFTEVEDHAGLAAHIERMVASPELLSTLKAGAKHVADNVVSWPRIARMTEGVYEAAAEHRRRSP
jgi:glycosyltransferase involved in cell wall biosynthesis